jgi:hypothetical protein
MKPKLFSNKKGVSNSTVTILVIVSLLVSMVGTWLVLESLQTKYVVAPVNSKTEQSGLVQLSIDGPLAQKNMGVSGLVTLNLRE